MTQTYSTRRRVANVDERVFDLVRGHYYAIFTNVTELLLAGCEGLRRT